MQCFAVQSILNNYRPSSSSGPNEDTAGPSRGRKHKLENNRGNSSHGKCIKREPDSTASVKSEPNMSRVDPGPGPSRYSNTSTSGTNSNLNQDYSSDDEPPGMVQMSRNNRPSDVLTAPELQLDCFSDTSTSDTSSDVIAIVSTNTKL